MIDLSALSAERPYAVLGLGRSGRASAQALLAARIPVWAWDDAPAGREAARGAGIVPVDLDSKDLASAAGLILSPGIPHTYPAPHRLVVRARAAGCPIIGDGELLARSHPGAACVGITGTNGKSTTTALIGHILRVAGRPCAVGGNLGTPVLALETPSADGVYVLEMSSYQLELTPSLAFVVAVLLNVTPDHLDRHGGMAGYIAAKRSIFRGPRPNATAVVGVDDEICRAIADEMMATGSGTRVIRISGREHVPGGVGIAAGMLSDAVDHPAEPSPVVDLAEAPALPGEHNAQNAAAAYATARALGIERDVIAAAIRTFPGLAHRQERIAVLDGVTYVNDSKATNPDAAVRALACYDDIYWIAGGRPKEGGLDAIRPFVGRIRHAFLIGEAAEAFAAWFAGKIEATRCMTLERAVGEAATMAARDRRQRRVANPVVLLSPACASFDQFANFEARGDSFRALVEARIKATAR